MRFSRLGVARHAARTTLAVMLGGLLLAGGAHVRAQTGGNTVTYQAGYNLVAFPPNTDISSITTPLYTMQPGDTEYETIQPGQGTQSGFGYWAYFSSSGQITLDAGTSNVYSVIAPSGQYIMVGNPSGTQTALVTGADVVYTYDPTNSANPYNASPLLQPGQGAWVYSASGGPIVVQPGNASAPPPAGSRPPSARFYGAVTVHGAAASSGATVTATSSSGATCGQTTVGAPPATGSNYALDLIGTDSVSYTPLTLPTIYSVSISVVAVSLKKTVRSTM